MEVHPEISEISLFFASFRAAVVAQAVEHCHSVQASQVRISGWTWLFLAQNCCKSILAGLFLKNEESNGANSSSFFPVSHHHCQNLSIVIQTINQEKVKSKKRPG